MENASLEEGYMKYYEVIFVVLTYRNVQDLPEFLKSIQDNINKKKYKVIVVNSYFDEMTLHEIQNTAVSNNCDFLNVENKGYGYGNNRGIEYAIKNYSFKYLIISNPDIIIENLDLELLNKYENCIVGPLIKTLNGKNQNPYYYSQINIVEWLIYYSHIKNKKIFAYLGIAINKILRELMVLKSKIYKTKAMKVYAVHGSFVIFGINTLKKLCEVYDENMFLFAEENHLARLAKSKNINTIIIPKLKVLHKEDGSTSLLASKIMSQYAKESFITYYENWFGKK